MTDPELYNPPPFRSDDAAQVGRIVDATVFGTLVSSGREGPLASHVPFLLDRQAGDRGVLRAHVARANGHWQHLDGEPVLVVFQGPHHYVSPSFYASKALTGKVVPTWNYVLVQVRGRARVHHDRERLATLVEALTRHMESAREAPWEVADAPADFIERMLDAIVGVDVAIEHSEAKLKLGQNRSAADRESLAAALANERADVGEALERLLHRGP